MRYVQLSLSTPRLSAVQRQTVESVDAHVLLPLDHHGSICIPLVTVYSYVDSGGGGRSGGSNSFLTKCLYYNSKVIYNPQYHNIDGDSAHKDTSRFQISPASTSARVIEHPTGVGCDVVRCLLLQFTTGPLEACTPAAKWLIWLSRSFVEDGGFVEAWMTNR